jgi:CheY-like chemotaxis protein
MENFSNDRLTVMVIDDSEVDVTIFKKIVEFTSTGLNVISHLSALTAIEYFRRLGPDSKDVPSIIFLDINMPLMDGFEFLEEMKGHANEYFNKCRVIILSSSENPRDFEKWKKYRNVDSYIVKPLLPHDLLKIAASLQRA